MGLERKAERVREMVRHRETYRVRNFLKSEIQLPCVGHMGVFNIFLMENR